MEAPLINIDSLLKRESHFTSFVSDSLNPFWQRRDEWQFSGVDGIPIQCVRFTHSTHRKVVVIVSGFLESYAKYQELIYDFFNSGYDVFMFDHRGQGFSGRMLLKRDTVYVEQFSDYVTDLTTFWQENIAHANYQTRYLLGHSMGGAICSLFLAKRPLTVNAAALSAPMIGIKLPVPHWCINALINITQRFDSLRKARVIKRSAPLPFKLNWSCNSAVRYQFFIDLYYQYPETQLSGPTYHWVKEAIDAGRQTVACAEKIKTPLLLLQAQREHLVSNRTQNAFVESRRRAGIDDFAGGLISYPNAAHEILFDRDEIRTQALNHIIRFFERHQ